MTGEVQQQAVERETTQQREQTESEAINSQSPSDTLSSTRLHLPKQCHSRGPRAQMHEAMGDSSHSNHDNSSAEL